MCMDKKFQDFSRYICKSNHTKIELVSILAAVFSTRETTAALAPPAAETTATSFPSVEAGVEVGVPLATATALACQVHSNPGLEIGSVFGNVTFWICFSHEFRVVFVSF